MLRYALAIFVSAFLLFQVQPLIGRFVLPWFGGGPSIWTTCMLFFQVLLLGGYLYAHLISTRLTVRTQVITHCVMLGLSIVFLPIVPSDYWKPDPEQSPTWQIFLLLAATVGGPYFMLSTTGPLLQRWFSRTSPEASPYRLYALSNVGSLLALLSYPFVFEPWLRLRQQALSWTGVYLVFVGLVIWCAIKLWHQQDRGNAGSASAPGDSLVAPDLPASTAPSFWQKLQWLLLSASGSIMLLATTNQLCIDVATVPFLWILPLAIYLFTFVLCFDSPRWYDRRVFGLLYLIAIPWAFWALRLEAEAAILDQVVVYSTVLIVCCMTCHGELARSKPTSHYLTQYFVIVSAGGALGGLFVAIVATKYFLGYWEYHIGIAACALVSIWAWCSQKVWKNPISPGFWIGVAILGVQFITVAMAIYTPIADMLAVRGKVMIFGVYAAVLLLSVVATVSWEHNRKVVGGVWIVSCAVQMVWLLACSRMSFPGMMTQRMLVLLALGMVLPLLAGLLLLVLATRQDDPVRRIFMRTLLTSVAVAGFATCWYLKWLSLWQVEVLAIASLIALILDWSVLHFGGKSNRSLGAWFWLPTMVLWGMACVQLYELANVSGPDVVLQSRNFYGVLKVRFEDLSEAEFAQSDGKYTLSHGQILHGFQYTDDHWKLQPTTYYGRDSGIGLAIRLSAELAEKTDKHSLRVGVVGLGTGTIASYGKAGDDYRFYDINAAVADLSNNYFSYLRDTPAKTKVVLGDARITMERELKSGDQQNFDVLAIDAFSSDAIPVHLLTTECGAIYKQHLRQGGILALHVSNRFLNLEPVARGLANSLGWQAIRIDSDEDESMGTSAAVWILVTENPEFIQNEDLNEMMTTWEESEEVIPWTDDYSALWRVLSN